MLTPMPCPPSTLLYLESRFDDLATQDQSTLRAAFLMGLQYPGAYRVERAVAWAEQGYILDDDSVLELRRIAASHAKQFPQGLRHRALSLVREYERTLLSGRAG